MYVVCLKLLKMSAFRSSEPLFLLRINGRVRTIPTYRVHRLYDMMTNVGEILCSCCAAWGEWDYCVHVCVSVWSKANYQLVTSSTRDGGLSTPVFVLLLYVNCVLCRTRPPL